MPDDAVPVGAMLLEGARRWGLEHPIETANIFGHWREIVGDQVAARCEPLGLTRGVLKVRAATPAWANELRYLAPEVIRRVNAGGGPGPGSGVVKELKVVLAASEGTSGGGRGRRVQHGASAPEQANAPALDERRPRVFYGTAPSAGEIDRLVEGIADDRLAAATKRALLAAKTRSGER
jgi:hypothetical protein